MTNRIGSCITKTQDKINLSGIVGKLHREAYYFADKHKVSIKQDAQRRASDIHGLKNRLRATFFGVKLEGPRQALKKFQFPLGKEIETIKVDDSLKSNIAQMVCARAYLENVSHDVVSPIDSNLRDKKVVEATLKEIDRLYKEINPQCQSA